MKNDVRADINRSSFVFAHVLLLAMGALSKGKVALDHVMQLDEWANVILESDQNMSLAHVGVPPAGALAWGPIEGNARMEALRSWFGDQVPRRLRCPIRSAALHRSGSCN